MSSTLSSGLLFLVIAVITLFYSHDLHNPIVLEDSYGVEIEMSVKNAGNHVYPYLASCITCGCCTAIVCILICYNNIMKNAGMGEWTRRLRGEEFVADW